VVGAANVLVDPYGLFPEANLKPLRPYESRRGSRIAKAADLARGGFRSAIFGTSRSEVGFDPRHPKITPQPAYNAALAGTSMVELGRVYAFADERNALELALFGLDFILFNEHGGFGDDYEASLFALDRDGLLAAAPLLLSQRSLDATLESLGRAARGSATDYTEQGRRARKIQDVRSNTLARCAFALRQIFTSPALYAGYSLSGARLSEMREIVAARGSAGLRTVIVVTPAHALLLETIRASGLWGEFERFKRALAEFDALGAVVYDFTGYNEYTTEPLPIDEPSREMRWHWEVSHFRKELGDLVLDLALGEPADPDALAPTSFGQRLTPETIEPHLARIRTEREAWLPGAAEQLAWFRGVLNLPDPAED